MKQRILIVGAGFGGLWSALSATRLLDIHSRTDVEVTVLAPQAELRVRPRFYEAGVHRMKAPLGELFAAVGVRFVKGLVDRIDVQGQRVAYRDERGAGAELAYDRLVLATGSAWSGLRWPVSSMPSTSTRSKKPCAWKSTSARSARVRPPGPAIR